MDFIFRKSDEASFLHCWNDYIQSHTASFRYLPAYLNYQLNYSSSLVSDESFAIVLDRRVVGICFLPIELQRAALVIGLGGDFTYGPLTESEKAERACFEKIEEIARIKEVKKIMLYVDPLSYFPEKTFFNPLKKFNYIDTSGADCILNLRISENELWNGVRKGHKSDIKKILSDSEYRIIRVDSENADYDIHEKYRVLHRKCSGKETRSKQTFDNQFEMLTRNQATLFGLLRNNHFIGFNYFLHNQKTVIYMSGADDPEIKGIPIYHPILWSAICYYQQKEFSLMQLSWPAGYSNIGGFSDYSDEKQLHIARFKRGFGADTVTRYRGTRYLDQHYFLEDLETFRRRALADHFGHIDVACSQHLTL